MFSRDQNLGGFLNTWIWAASIAQWHGDYHARQKTTGGLTKTLLMVLLITDQSRLL